MPFIRSNNAEDLRSLTDAEIRELAALVHTEFANRKITTRRPIDGAAEAPAITPGVKVCIGTVTPKYMSGRTGVVRNVNDTHADVELDDWTRVHQRYFHITNGTKVVRTPLTSLRVTA